MKKLVDLKPNEKAIVYGTIYKQMELKPSILREISDEVGIFLILRIVNKILLICQKYFSIPECPYIFRIHLVHFFLTRI